jgi:hypothetical protein
MAWTLAEELLLVAYTSKGRPMADETSLSAALAGAAVMDLVLTGGLRLTGGRLAMTASPPSDRRLAALAVMADGRSPKHAIIKISGGVLRDAMLYDLVAAGAFTVAPGRLLGVFPTTLWTPVGNAPVMARLRMVVLDRRAPDPRTAALVSLLQTVNVLPKLFPEAGRRAIGQRGREISTGSWATAAVRKAVQEPRAKALAALIAKWLPI